MSDKNTDLFIIILGFISFCVISWFAGAFHEANKVHDTHSIVTSANNKRVILKSGLRVENKGFNVGDTLVIINK